jgi:hypothetical protein
MGADGTNKLLLMWSEIFVARVGCYFPAYGTKSLYFDSTAYALEDGIFGRLDIDKIRGTI